MKLRDVIVVIVAMNVAMGVVAFLMFQNGYQRGQIDAQTGKIRWHLTTQPDGEVVWREKE